MVRALVARAIEVHKSITIFADVEICPFRMISMATKPVVPPTPNLPVAPKAPEDGGGALVVERLQQRVEPPKMYQVVMLNDDFTPMEFVIEVLQHFFGKSRESATQIMLKIHLDGKGVCGVYLHEIAETKVAQVMDAAHGAGHPLQAVTEPVE